MHNKDIDTSLKSFQYLSSAMSRSVVYEREIFNNFDIFEKFMKTHVTTPLQFNCSWPTIKIHTVIISLCISLWRVHTCCSRSLSSLVWQRHYKQTFLFWFISRGIKQISNSFKMLSSKECIIISDVLYPNS